MMSNYNTRNFTMMLSYNCIFRVCKISHHYSFLVCFQSIIRKMNNNIPSDVCILFALFITVNVVVRVSRIREFHVNAKLLQYTLQHQKFRIITFYVLFC